VPSSAQARETARIVPDLAQLLRLACMRAACAREFREESTMRTAPRTALRLLGGLAGALQAAPARAQEAGAAVPAVAIDSGDVAWVLTSSAIVLMMTLPGLSLFYGGLVRGKNVLSIFMQCLITAAVVSVTWVLWGYSLAFGPDHLGVIGDLSLFGLQGVSHAEVQSGTKIPQQAFMVFQLMFAVITPALIVGAVAERMKFSAFLLFVLFWSTFIYSPLAHWVWGGGWLMQRGALDFAGGTVVHISSGTSALIAAAMIGRRRGFGREPMPPHNVPFTVVGAALLWVGWFGFNSGSALAANELATLAFVNTNTATGAAVLGWMFSEWIGRGKPTALGAASGAVAGLVAITPAAGFVAPWASILIGFVAGILCYKACSWKLRVGYDDALDVVGVHGVGGTWGALATGLFATVAVNAAGRDGLFYGNPEQLLTQAVGVAATYAIAGFGTFLILGIVNSVVGLRVDEGDEETGLDLSLHSESAYSTSGGGSSIGERPSRREHAEPRPVAARSAPSSGTRRPPTLGTGRPDVLSTGRPDVLSTGRPDLPGSRAEPARPAASGASSPGAMAAPSGADGSFRISIDGIDPKALSSWWRGLCTQDARKAPEAFRDIYPNVRSFEGTAFQFRGGDPAGTRDRLAYLLEIYGAAPSAVRID
jgi:Amt family ammonium transporter